MAGGYIFFLSLAATVALAGIETDSNWKSIEHHELHRPTNGMFAQAGKVAVGKMADGVILVVPIGSMYFMASQPTPP